MYHVLIVDDEYLASDKLCTMINWEKYGFHIVGTASNGQEAINFIKETPVDVIFSDVCMPIVDGVELARYVNKNEPNTKVVIMSSYSDFEYVKECFAANACDYVLKHLLTSETLIKILQKLSETYLKDRENFSLSYNEYVKAKEYRRNIIDMLRDNSDAQPICGSVIAAVKLNSNIMLEYVHSSNETQMFYRHIINTISQILKNMQGFVIFQEPDNTIVIYMPFGDTDETKIISEIHEYINQINYSIKKFFDLNLKWGISCVSSDNYKLSECYKESLLMLNKKPILSKKDNEISETTTFNSLSIDNEKNIISAVQSLGNDRIDSELELIFKDIPSQQLALNIIVSELITLANKICTEFNIDIRDLSDSLSKLNHAVNSNCSKSDIVDSNKQLFHSIISLINDHKHHKQKYSTMIKEYIHSHYMEDIGLKHIAQNIGITEPYVSTVFKEETGDTISAYLTNYRIEKAKELLSQNVDIKFLYSAVGFKSYNYFFSAFKKVVGCTPRQYQRINNK